MSATAGKRPEHFGLKGLPKGIYFSSIEQAERQDSLLGQLHHMRRAFEAMQLDGILCVDDRPTVYFRDFKAPLTRHQANSLHKQCWNQGVAPILILQDPVQVHIFSGLIRPSNEETAPPDQHEAFVEALNRTADTLEAHQLVQNIASGHYYRENKSKFFDSTRTVDQFLVKMLGDVCDHLNKSGSPDSIRHIHAFLGRLIFACYLVDRGIIRLADYSFIARKDVEKVPDLFERYTPSESLSILFDRLFPALKREFNGSTFDTDLSDERRLIRETEIDVLKRFFRGEELDSAQKSLGFWAFDFSFIPVETISAIYEKFLDREDSKDKEIKGAFYTPRHLAEMVVSEALEGWGELLKRRFLDPCCGSGIFLVILFKRLAEEWDLHNRNVSVGEKIEGLLDIFQHLRGIDVNETACRITCFSLYIAFLDQFDPPTLRALKEEAGLGSRKPLLPPLLAYKKDAYCIPDTAVIFEGNFFDAKVPLERNFDLVIGNPPWVSRQAAGESVTSWIESDENPGGSSLGKGVTQRKRTLLPQDQIALAFLWKTPTHLTSDGRGCLVLPSQILLNQTDDFQLGWFSRYSATRLLHLADFRRFLFENATRPCFILRFSAKKPQESAIIEYAVPKVMRLEPRSGLIPACADDRKFIRLDDLLEAAKEGKAALVWKTRLWGTHRDLKLISALLTYPKIGEHAGEPGESSRFRKGKGFQPWYQAGHDNALETYGDPKPLPGKLSDPSVGEMTASVQLFGLKRDAQQLQKVLAACRYSGKSDEVPEQNLKASSKGFRRSPNAKLYQAPVVLVSKGFGNVAFFDFNVIFKDPITGISGNSDDKQVLLLLAAYLRSKLAWYLVFHTAGSLGAEREEVRLHELLRLPFPLPDSEQAVPQAWNIVRSVAAEVQKVREAVELGYTDEASGQVLLRDKSVEEYRIDLVERLQRKLEPLIHRYFGVTSDDAAVIEDTYDIYSASATPSSPSANVKTLQRTSEINRQQFSECLCRMLNHWAVFGQPANTQPKRYFVAEHGILPRNGLCIVMLRRTAKDTPPKETKDISKLEDALARIALASRNVSGPFDYLRSIIHATPDVIYILKPDLLGQWTRTAALNAAEGIFGAITTSNRDHSRG
jgi:N-6 DNA Methylase